MGRLLHVIHQHKNPKLIVKGSIQGMSSLLHKIVKHSPGRIRKESSNDSACLEAAHRTIAPNQSLVDDRDESECHNRHSDVSKQLMHISCESYNEELRLLRLENYEEALEYLEAALAARLVIYGPANQCLIEVHHKLKQIANTQGDTNKVIYHEHKIDDIQSAIRNARILNYDTRYHDTIDWSRLH